MSDPSGPTLNRQGSRETWLLAALLVVALRHFATQCRALVKHGRRLGVVQLVNIKHALSRRVAPHALMPEPLAHDVLCDLALQR